MQDLIFIILDARVYLVDHLLGMKQFVRDSVYF